MPRAMSDASSPGGPPHLTPSSNPSVTGAAAAAGGGSRSRPALRLPGFSEVDAALRTDKRPRTSAPTSPPKSTWHPSAPAAGLSAAVGASAAVGPSAAAVGASVAGGASAASTRNPSQHSQPGQQRRQAPFYQHQPHDHFSQPHPHRQQHASQSRPQRQQQEHNLYQTQHHGRQYQSPRELQVRQGQPHFQERDPEQFQRYPALQPQSQRETIHHPQPSILHHHQSAEPYVQDQDQQLRQQTHLQSFGPGSNPSSPPSPPGVARPKKMLHREVEQARRHRMSTQIDALRAQLAPGAGPRSKADKVSVLQAAVAFISSANAQIASLKSQVAEANSEVARLREALHRVQSRSEGAPPDASLRESEAVFSSAVAAPPQSATGHGACVSKLSPRPESPGRSAGRISVVPGATTSAGDQGTVTREQRSRWSQRDLDLQERHAPAETKRSSLPRGGNVFGSTQNVHHHLPGHYRAAGDVRSSRAPQSLSAAEQVWAVPDRERETGQLQPRFFEQGQNQQQRRRPSPQALQPQPMVTGIPSIDAEREPPTGVSHFGHMQPLNPLRQPIPAGMGTGVDPQSRSVGDARLPPGLAGAHHTIPMSSSPAGQHFEGPSGLPMPGQGRNDEATAPSTLANSNAEAGMDSTQQGNVYSSRSFPSHSGADHISNFMR